MVFKREASELLKELREGFFGHSKIISCLSTNDFAVKKVGAMTTSGGVITPSGSNKRRVVRAD